MREKKKGGGVVEGVALADGKGGYLPYKAKKASKPNSWRGSAAESLMRKG